MTLRPARLDDATALSALSIQVFLDTYATHGVSPAIAREALIDHGVAALTERLQDTQLAITVAEQNGALLGFIQTSRVAHITPAGNRLGCEVQRLYVQPGFQKQGVGLRLLHSAEALPTSVSAGAVWLTAWSDNHRARTFYQRCGYDDVGSSPYCYEDQTFENRVLVKTLQSLGSPKYS